MYTVGMKYEDMHIMFGIKLCPFPTCYEKVGPVRIYKHKLVLIQRQRQFTRSSCVEANDVSCPYYSRVIDCRSAA